MNQVFVGGPKDGTTETYPSPVPPVIVPVYQEKDGMLCADEQVTKKLGQYRRAGEIVHRGKKAGQWIYYWEAE